MKKLAVLSTIILSLVLGGCDNGDPFKSHNFNNQKDPFASSYQPESVEEVPQTPSEPVYAPKEEDDSLINTDMLIGAGIGYMASELLDSRDDDYDRRRYTEYKEPRDNSTYKPMVKPKKLVLENKPKKESKVKTFIKKPIKKVKSTFKRRK